MTETTGRTLAIAEAIPRRSWRFLLLLVGIGAVGVASMLFVPVEQLLPAGLEVPRALLLIQPAILVVGLSAAGWWAAPKLGLDAPALGALADGGDWIGALRPMLLPAIAGGLLCAFCIALFGFATADLLDGRAQAIELPLVTRMLYGGTVEEIIFRWALMPLVALGLCRLSAPRGTALAAANLIAAPAVRRRAYPRNRHSRPGFAGLARAGGDGSEYGDRADLRLAVRPPRVRGGDDRARAGAPVFGAASDALGVIRWRLAALLAGVAGSASATHAPSSSRAQRRQSRASLLRPECSSLRPRNDDGS